MRPVTTAFRPRSRIVAMALLLSLGSGGCYRSVVLSGQPEPGARVRASLTDAGRDAMADVIGPDVQAVEGETARVGAEGWTLLLLSTWQLGGSETPWNREPVTFAREYLTRAELRQLDKRRTWLTAGIVAVGMVVLGRQFVKGWGGGNGQDNGEQPGH